MALHRYWLPVQENKVATGTSGPPRDSNGVIEMGLVSANRTEADSVLRVIADAYMGFRVPPHMGTDPVPPGWFALSDAMMVVGFGPNNHSTYPFLTTAEQEQLLGVTSLTMRAVMDPKDQASSYVWYKTESTFSFEGQRKGTGNAGEFPSVYFSLSWATFDLVGQLPGYAFDYALFVRGRVLFGSESL